MDSRTIGDSSSFNLGWEELFEDSPAEERPIPGAVDDCVDSDTESLLLAASQLFKSGQAEPPTRRFGAPRSALEIAQVEDSHIPRKTRANTTWAIRIWREWATDRLENLTPVEGTDFHTLFSDISKISDESIAFWLQRFVLEARRVNGENYCPDSLYQLCCGLHQALRNADRDINFFEQFTFCHFRSVLDGELKRLNATGKYVHKKKACVITVEMEEILWEKGLLGDNSPQVLCDTLVYLIGLFFAFLQCFSLEPLKLLGQQLLLCLPPISGESSVILLLFEIGTFYEANPGLCFSRQPLHDEKKLYIQGFKIKGGGDLSSNIQLHTDFIVV